MIYNPAMQISNYTVKLVEALESGHAREHSYRPALKDLFSSFLDALAVNEPKRSEFGSPDFIIISEKNHDIVLGHAEAKDINVSLDKIEVSEQMRRYSGYPKIILTNGLEFRFFENGDKYETVIIGTLKNSAIDFDETQYNRLSNEIAAFLERPPESIRSGKRLAQIMGDKARRIRDNIIIYLKDEDKARSEELRKIYEMMKVLLVHDLSEEKFADMYAQTLVYGLFVARYSDKTPDSFTRQEARDLVPKSNPFLQKFFDHIAGPDFDVRLGRIVDELCAVFMVSDVQMLVHKHLRILENTDEKDPIIHFYEDFLKEYDPNERKRMGAYYTPIPVVQFIVRQVDRILKEDFGITKGLADNEKKSVGTYKHSTKQTLHRIQILDPAVGTATFLNETIKHIHKDFEGQEGRWGSYVKEDLLPRLHGFELMMAPYTIAHLKLGMTLQETGVKDLSQRLGVYLTNTLEEGWKNQSDIFSALGLTAAVAEEANAAAKIKHERPIMVVVGNPPYSVSSNNKSEYIQNLVADYKKDLNERNIQPLSDDYIKFIRFAEDMIGKTGEGIVALITNNSYLEGIIHRRMREHLLLTFDKVYILDLHGNSKKNEISPDGLKDENVFDIQQGVGIILAIKTNTKAKTQLGKIYHSEIFGSRKKKFELLNQGDINFVQVKYTKPEYFFTPKDTKLLKKYEDFISVSNIFNKQSSGITTSNDAELVSFEHHNYLEGIEIPYSYKPFDVRYLDYTSSITRPRKGFTELFFKPNIGLSLMRKPVNSEIMSTVLVTNSMVDKNFFGFQSYSFPLYIYREDGARYCNINQHEIARLTDNLVKEYPPEYIFSYVYAILYSPKYREKYQEFLKIDFPRIPIPKNDEEFTLLSSFGKQLQDLHLTTSPMLNLLNTTYSESGSDIVEEVKYWPEDTKTFWKDDPEQIVHKARTVTINKEQYFGNVPEIAWNFHIGGYQPAQKWLKDRKGQKLTSDDIVHYQKIIKALAETDRIMKEIDKVWTP